MNSRLFSITMAAVLALSFGTGSDFVLAGGHHLANGCDTCGSHGCRHCGGHGCHHCCGRRGWDGEWAGGYYHTMWGQPVALVVPPTADLQTHWNWGVAQTRITPIWPQYTRGFPGPYVGGRGFLPTPRWPSSTDQFGVYYVRGPW
jgi:hypothetical protein